MTINDRSFSQPAHGSAARPQTINKRKNNKLVIGLTGGIGSGKSATSDWFAAKGIDIIDADVIAHEVVAKGSATLRKIQKKFGDSRRIFFERNFVKKNTELEFSDSTNVMTLYSDR